MNYPINSNSYILNYNNGICFTIIDSGFRDSNDIEKYILKLSPQHVFITHEHFNHIWGLNKLRKSFILTSCIVFEECYILIR